MELTEKPGQLEKLILFFAIALVVFFLAASPLEASASTSIRFLHLAPDAGPVDAWIDGQLVSQGLKFKENTEYIETNPAKHRVICKTKDGSDPTVLNALFPFRKDKEYTVALTGNRRTDDLQLLFLVDNCPPTEKLAQVKFTNAVRGSPLADLSIKYGPTLYSRLAFRTRGGCQLIPPDNYPFRLSEAESGSLMAEKKMTLKSGTRYNIFATRSGKGDGVDILALPKPNAPEEEPKIFGVERSVLQLLGAGLIASLVILVLGR